MKINKEQFNKLSQLDRIEFRQRQREIEEKYPITISGMVNSIFLIIFLFMCITIVNIYLVVIGSSDVITPALWILIIIPLAYIGDMISMIMNSKRTKELCEEYFKVEVKKK